jgi:hypothetical protein
MKRGDVVMFLWNDPANLIKVGAIGIVRKRDPWPTDLFHRDWPNGKVGKCWIVDDGADPWGPICDVRPEDVEVLP